MPGKEMQRSGRTDGLSRRFEAPPAGEVPELAAPVALLVRARWVILLLLGVYALYATTFYSFGRFGFYLSLNQSAFLLLSLAFAWSSAWRCCSSDLALYSAKEQGRSCYRKYSDLKGTGEGGGGVGGGGAAFTVNGERRRGMMKQLDA